MHSTYNSSKITISEKKQKNVTQQEEKKINKLKELRNYSDDKISRKENQTSF